jgi:hypothetical protein
LTKRERIAGDLPEDREYRLPLDEEWSAAVGLKKEVGSTPEEKSGKIRLYSWDIPQKRAQSWPPPPGSGNYCGEEWTIGNEPKDWSVIEGYNDGYPRTNPVGRFEANFSGLHDMWATYGNGAKIGTMIKGKTICCEVRRGALAPSTTCSHPIVATARPDIATMKSVFAVLWLGSLHGSLVFC